MTTVVRQWKSYPNRLVYLCYPLVHAVNVNDSKEVSDKDTDDNVVECEPLQDYCISLNYGRSRINAWSHVVAWRNSIIIKINAKSRINAGSFVGPQ